MEARKRNENVDYGKEKYAWGGGRGGLRLKKKKGDKAWERVGEWQSRSVGGETVWK